MTLLCKPDECTLLIVDTQARLMPARCTPWAPVSCTLKPCHSKPAAS